MKPAVKWLSTNSPELLRRVREAIMNDPLYRYGLLAYFIIYFLFGFLLRSLLVYRRTGINPFVIPRSDDAYGYVGRAFKFVVIGVALTITTIAFSSEASWWLGGLVWGFSPICFYTGWMLLILSLIWLFIAQMEMANSWRIGIDTEHRTELVRHGLFAISRNPIFLAIRGTLLGLLLIFPSAATIVLFTAGDIFMQVQVRLEEQHLLSMHGELYAQYRSRVRRWL
jgi:protein-S-isoprenylcysteine O-methyltransferase Ste14